LLPSAASRPRNCETAANFDPHQRGRNSLIRRALCQKQAESRLGADRFCQEPQFGKRGNSQLAIQNDGWRARWVAIGIQHRSTQFRAMLKSRPFSRCFGTPMLSAVGTKIELYPRKIPAETGDGGRHGTPADPRYCLTHCECLGTRAAGECPEWQRGRTVNPLAYAFVGSSPTSPTSPTRV
jgi:hypothetical protein